MIIMRRVWTLLALASVALTGIQAQDDSVVATEPAEKASIVAAIPQHAEEPKALVKEDADFDPYDDKQAAKAIQAEDNAQGAVNAVLEDTKYHPKQRKVELFDFDPSEGLTFHVYSGKKECFYQDAKFMGDEISGAYIVSSADSHIDLEVKNPAGVVVYRRFGDAEGQYQVRPTEEGIHELCFINSDSDGKLVTHVTNTLKSQHPVEREHVSVLAKYASHLDVRLGELESEQRLQQIRTDRFIKVEESTSQRVAFYGTLECFVYFLICLYQVLYIKGLLDGPRQSLPTRKTWA